jgi:tetratricopeptide (TPR) repeat protein
MTDPNAHAIDSPLTPEEFEAAMNQPLLDGPMMMTFDDAQALYAQCLHFASIKLNDAWYCKSLVALSEVYLQKEEPDKAIPLLKLALEVLEHYLPPRHERVGAMHYLLAFAYQCNAEYDLACKHWIAVIHCFDWLPADAPVLREAAEELFYCRSKKCGMSDSQFYASDSSIISLVSDLVMRDTNWREVA